ncbi:hypothetical protein WHR41_09351 [Cladosporium halotolerans]|uniref:Helicase ATP-binding domain-containing protein n=1 Tax=Cladosporium halotolerans TaxID=1052096 RepID=A0AB34KFP4_9PEZI
MSISDDDDDFELSSSDELELPASAQWRKRRVVFPTGGGKSLCYQVPGVAIKRLNKLSGVRQGHAEGGITLVVSPLIALMKDQVDALKRLGIRAEAMDSSKSKEEYLSAVNGMREGLLDILYCVPERLNDEGFVASMASVKGGVRLLAADEAHCISEWGHAFRPDYLKVARFAKGIQAERVICLTATATPKVAEDVCKAFEISPEEGVFRTATYRDKLHLYARSFLTKEESYPELIKFLNQHPGPSIVERVVSRLNDWNERGFIQLETKNVHQIYLVLKPLPSSGQDRQALSDKVYRELEVREQQDLARMDEVTNLVVGKQCSALALAKHFGDELPDKAQECGHCTWCETHQPVELKKPPQVPWDSKAFVKILEAPTGHAGEAVEASCVRLEGRLQFTTLLDAFTKVCDGE